jgi:hypothetical protein
MVNAVHVEMGPTGPTMAHEYHVGHFNTHVEAERWVITNNGYYCRSRPDRYNYCVIKEITLELYPRVVREEWFEWVKGRYSYVPKPPVREITQTACTGDNIWKQ